MTEVTRASTTTTLRLGAVEAPVGLFKTTGDPKQRKYETAGPHGGALRRKVDAVPDPEPTPIDAFGVQPGEAEKAEPASEPVAVADLLYEEGHEDEPITPDEVRRGIRREDGTFVDLTEQLAKAEEDSRLERMEVVAFLSARQVPRERVLSTYYLGSTNEDKDPTTTGRVLRILYEALRAKRRAAVVRFTKRKGQTLGVVVPYGRQGALLLLELAFAEHFRTPNKRCLAHMSAHVTEGEVARAVELVEAMAGRRNDLDDIRDRRAALEAELVARAEAGELDAYEPVEEAPEAELLDLEALLSASTPAAA